MRQWEIRPIFVEEKFQPAHAIENQFRGRGNKDGIPRPASTDPILTAPEFAGLRLAPTALRKKNLVNFTNQPQQKWKSRS
jgi:hypothetical protein